MSKKLKNFNPFNFYKKLTELLYFYYIFNSYKRKDGSFSAFGERDEFGSLWLTAFVLKCFKQATKLEGGMKEQLRVHIEDATRFISNYSKSDGSFQDLGRVIHREMQVFYQKLSYIYLPNTLIVPSRQKFFKCN